MKKEEKKVEFDLSVLNLKELIDVYENITDFLQYLEEQKIKLLDKEQENG